MNTAFQKTGRSRADLVRLLAAVPREERTLAAATLGFVREREAEPKVQITIENNPSLVLETEPTDLSDEEPLPVAPIVQAPLWRFENMVFHQEPGEMEPAREEVRGLTPEDLHGTGQSLFATPKASPLAPWSKLWPRLRQVLHSTTTSRDPDVAKWVRRVAQGEIIARIPRLQRKTWPSRLSIWVDRSRRLIPIWADQMAVIRQLYQVCDRRNLNIRWIDARTRAKALGERGDFLQNIRLDGQTPVLMLGDLGEFGTDAERHAWRKTAIRLRRQEVRSSALVPLGRSRSTPDLSRIWNAIPWEQGRVRVGYALSKNTQTCPERAEQLLTMVSPAAYVQPGLLRALRLLLPPEHADVSTELDVWNHADVRGADAAGMVLQAEAAEKWRKNVCGGHRFDLAGAGE